MSKSTAILLGFFAYTILSGGFILMKKGVSWIGWKEKKTKKYYENLFIWIAGFILTNLSVIPNAIALKVLPPYIVSSIAGWGIIVLIILSYLFLKEKLYKTDIIYSIFIIIGITSLNYFSRETAIKLINPSGIIITAFIPVGIIIPAFFKISSRKIKTIIFSSVSGLSAGLLIIFLKLLVTNYGYNLKLYLTSPFFYGYITASISTFVTIQIAYKLGEMILIGPTQYSTNIVYPAIASILIFSAPLSIIQIISIILIVIGVVNILLKH